MNKAGRNYDLSKNVLHKPTLTHFTLTCTKVLHIQEPNWLRIFLYIRQYFLSEEYNFPVLALADDTIVLSLYFGSEKGKITRV